MATTLAGSRFVALDTETTGLSVWRDAVVSIALVELVDGHPAAAPLIDARVRPGRSIPASATAIHGIADADVAAAAPLSSLWPRLTTGFDGAVVVGHGIGFDMAILKREARRAALPWRAPPTLDTRALSVALEPRLLHLDLAEIAHRHGVECGARHTALGDALTAARLFGHLVGRLEAIGVHTVAAAAAFAERAHALR
ncbi:MAG: 3'-5' exonuclease [Alphaproteobacteria bacterium]|nr:3'-5' exonuclease [Alphaproteobacteria bacterium]MCW5741003.1 3'-5' exonuclease [Alphaproteobacteria bacterium]